MAGLILVYLASKIYLRPPIYKAGDSRPAPQERKRMRYIAFQSRWEHHEEWHWNCKDCDTTVRSTTKQRRTKTGIQPLSLQWSTTPPWKFIYYSFILYRCKQEISPVREPTQALTTHWCEQEISPVQELFPGPSGISHNKRVVIDSPSYCGTVGFSTTFYVCSKELPLIFRLLVHQKIPTLLRILLSS